MRQEPTISRLRELLSYDSRTGRFEWRHSGKRAATRIPAGNIIIVDGVKCYTRRIAWMLMTGTKLGKRRVRHKDGNQFNDSFDNLYVDPLPKPKLTAELLRSFLNYDPETGEFTRRVSVNRWKAGERVGCLDKSTGYVEVGVAGLGAYKAHRLAWLYTYGKWPNKALDHVDGDKTNNRIANLREATPTQNKANAKTHSDNLSGLKGVHWDRRNKRNPYQASIRVDGKLKHLGMFPTAEQAHAAYCEAASKYFGEFARAS